MLSWLGCGLSIADEGRAYRSAAWAIGALVLPAVVGFHLLIASRSSSTAGMGYPTIPFPLHVATAVATVCANAVAARSVDLT